MLTEIICALAAILEGSLVVSVRVMRSLGLW